ncbi:hypothetical protein RIF29_41967 [Crotalaria pallida]|uniref:Uncharacterized protein n=1 Tax=Crotalaria pallida TaxID=3830 RepID=A0AAN9EBK5_CROPI
MADNLKEALNTCKYKPVQILHVTSQDYSSFEHPQLANIWRDAKLHAFHNECKLFTCIGFFFLIHNKMIILLKFILFYFLTFYNALDFANPVHLVPPIKSP